MEAKTLTEMGHDVKLYFLRGTEKGRVYLDQLKDINYEVLTWRNSSLLVPLYDFVTSIFMPSRKGEGRVDYNLIRKFPKIIENENFDLLICHDQFSGLAGYYSKKKFNLDYIVYIHERLNDYPWISGIFKRLIVRMAIKYQSKILKSAHKVLGVTDKVAMTVSECYGVDAIGNLPGLTKHNRISYGDKRNDIVSISYWSEVKKPLSYIPFIKELEGYRFLMLGSWISNNLKKSFIKELDNNKIMEKVILSEDVEEEEKYNFLGKAKFFLRFGFGEYGPSMGIIESLEAGTPVIINADIGIADLIANKNLGHVIEFDKPDKLIHYLKNIDSEVPYYQLQKNIEEFIITHSWVNHCDKFFQ